MAYTALDVYQALRDLTGREDLARLGTAIFLHERGPAGYEAGYGYTDSGPLPQWRGFRRQIEGVAGELTRFFGKDKPVNAYTLREFWAQEWRSSDPGWAAKVWTWYNRVQGMSADSLAKTPVGRSNERLFSFPSTMPNIPRIEKKLTPVGKKSADLRTYAALGFGMIALATVWGMMRGRR